MGTSLTHATYTKQANTRPRGLQRYQSHHRFSSVGTTVTVLGDVNGCLPY